LVGGPGSGNFKGGKGSERKNYFQVINFFKSFGFQKGSWVGDIPILFLQLEKEKVG